MSESSYLKLIEIQEQPDEYQTVIAERIRKIGSFSILGPPDLLHLTRAKVKTQFLAKPKKQTKSSFTFITGLNVQNVAYLNSLINKLMNYQKKQKSSTGDVEKAHFCIFDAFRRIDIHIEINIPGSNHIYGYDKNEKKVPVTEEMYTAAFYSSTLRAMTIKHFPFVKIYDQISSTKFLQNFVHIFVPFALSNHIEGSRDANPIATKGNYSIHLLFKYLIDRGALNILKQAIQLIRPRSEQLAGLLGCEIEFSRENYRKVVKSSAEVLVHNPWMSTFLYVQAKALLQCKRYNEVIKICRNVVFQGMGCYEVWSLLAKAYFYIKDYKTLFMLINTAVTLCEEPEQYLNPTSRQMTKLEIPTMMLMNDSFNVIKPTVIKESSLLVDYYFKFDNWFLDKFGKTKSLRENLKKLKRELQIADYLERTQKSLKQVNNGFYKILIMIEREKNWQYLINIRSRIFWLQSDFDNISKLMNETFQVPYHQGDASVMFEPGADINERSFISMKDKSGSEEDSFSSKNSKHKRSATREKTEEYAQKSQDTSQKQLPKLVFNDEDRVQERIQREIYEKSFELDPNNLSETDMKRLSSNSDTKNLRQPEPCSSRIKTASLENKELLINQLLREKVLCNSAFEKMFNDLYQDLLLQMQLENWMKQVITLEGLTNEKSEIVSIVMLKKAFLNKKLMRYRKSEETLKHALKFAKRNLTRIVAVYNLAEIYLETKQQQTIFIMIRNFRGAQLYLDELLNLLSEIGLKEYDVIPQWLQTIVVPILSNIGSPEKIKAVIEKWKPGPLKSVFQVCYAKFKAQL